MADIVMFAGGLVAAGIAFGVLLDRFLTWWVARDFRRRGACNQEESDA